MRENAFEGEPAGAAANPLVDALVQTAFVTMSVLTRVAAENDLSLTQLRVLAILRDRRLRMSALAAYLGLDKSTLSGLVDRAERRGLVRRTPDSADGRAVDVCLTPEGVALTSRLEAHVATSLAPRTNSLTQAETGQLATLLMGLLARV